MVITCQEEPLLFFDVRAFVDQRETAEPFRATSAEGARECVLRYMAFDRLKMDEATAAMRRATDLEIERMTQSRLLVHITAPLRWATAAVRKTAPGWSAKHL